MLRTSTSSILSSSEQMWPDSFTCFTVTVRGGFFIVSPASNQIYLMTLRPTQLTQASFLQKNQMLQNVFLISVTLRWHRASVACNLQLKLIILIFHVKKLNVAKCFFDIFNAEIAQCRQKLDVILETKVVQF